VGGELEHVAQCAGYGSIPEDLFRYGGSSARRRHMLLIRDYAGVKAWGDEAQQAMESASQDATLTLEGLPDIINVALEQLVRQRSSFRRSPLCIEPWPIESINRWFAIGLILRRENGLTIMLTRVEDETKSPLHRLKGEPKRPTTQNNREFLDHLAWLKEQAIGAGIFREIPDVKLKQFAAGTRSLDVTSMNDLTKTKRLTLAATLVFAQMGRALDDVGDMYVRLVQRLHNQARTALLEYQAEHVERTDSLVATLHVVTLAYWTEGSAEQRYQPLASSSNPTPIASWSYARPIRRLLEEIISPFSPGSAPISERPSSVS
jgi:hypothetical protein